MRSLIIMLVLATRLSGAETVAEFGATHSSWQENYGTVLILQERWDKYAVSFGLIGAQTIGGIRTNEQMIVGVERRFNVGRWTFGVGPYVFSDKNVISSANLNGRTFVEYSISNHWSVKFSHFSNANSGKDIKVRDAIIGMDCRDLTDVCVPYVHTEAEYNDFNKGYDMILFVWRF